MEGDLPELDPVLTWDPGMAGCSLTLWTTAPASENLSYNVLILED